VSAILVRNLRPGPTTLTPVENSSEYLVWQGAGDPEGQDVQLVSEEAAKSIPFQRAVARQLLAIEGDDAPKLDPMVQAHLDRQAAIAEAKRAQTEAEIENGIDRADQRVLHGIPCVGPNTRGTGECGVLVSVPGKNKDLTPPLCERHKPLAINYIAEVVEEGDKQITKWVRTEMGPREKASLK
jgi:hypothetical protein